MTDSYGELEGLRAAREAGGFTQADAGAIIHTGQSQYRKFEAGIVRLDVYRAKLLSEWLDLPINDFF